MKSMAFTATNVVKSMRTYLKRFDSSFLQDRNLGAHKIQTIVTLTQTSLVDRVEDLILIYLILNTIVPDIEIPFFQRDDMSARKLGFSDAISSLCILLFWHDWMSSRIFHNCIPGRYFSEIDEILN